MVRQAAARQKQSDPNAPVADTSANAKASVKQVEEAVALSTLDKATADQDVADAPVVEVPASDSSEAASVEAAVEKDEATLAASA